MNEKNGLLPGFGKRLKDKRKELGMSQSVLAKKSGIAFRSIQDYESEKRTPKIDARRDLANALGVIYTDIFVENYVDPSKTSINMTALKQGDIEHAIKEPAEIIATFRDENENPVTYTDHYEPAIDEERDQFKDLLSKTKLSAEKRAEMLNYFDFIKFKEEHKKE